MTLSPIQHNYVTKKEFGDFKTDANVRFDNIDYSIKDLKQFVVDGFEGMERYVDASFTAFEERFEQKMDNKFDQNKKDIIFEIKEHINLVMRK